MRRPSPLQPPLLRAEIEIISSCPAELKWEKGEGTNGASSSGGEGTLVTGRVFSWGQTRMQQRWIRSGWNFADRRIWLLLFFRCSRSCSQFVLGSIVKMAKFVVLPLASLIVVLCFLRLDLATTSIFRILTSSLLSCLGNFVSHYYVLFSSKKISHATIISNS